MTENRAGGAFGSAALAACAFLAGCGADDANTGQPPATSPATISVLPQPSSTTVVAPAPTVTIGEVPGNPDAVEALRPWVRDLVDGDIEQLVRKCWTIEPNNARDMYADRDGILAAVAQPGIDGQFAVIWRGPDRTVSVKRGEIASGYACPRVASTGATTTFNEADARYAVQRYLSRWVGTPVDPADVEGEYPLVCAGSVLANNPGRLTGSTGFGELTSTTTGRDNVEVSVPVTNSSGVTQPLVFTVTIGPEGYCVNDISG
ncbi:hypothetical protein HLB23_12615 [Nocardia uniformis]|uniref:Lipoprotein n=1 Tax=Nocardia uniformis TaxID=53432 RepID=A0A849C4H8_9NOCA|nr:hypothetical protein [Nocardia uniformis]NNH70697.1 hypothetical protein [Nocardia uniformis]